jgi:hypothetical protein
MQKDLRVALLCLAGLVSACSGGGGGGGGEPGSERSRNSPPAIAGQPDGVAAVGEFYSFKPTTRDPEGRALSFTIRNKPPWADFSSRDGRLSGTPGPDDLGSYIEITISASDGASKARLPDFQIDVIGRGEGSATLSWYPPTENADGSALTDLSGYRIYYGRHKRRLDNTIVLDNPGLTRYLVEGLSPGHWYFAMTSVNRKGAESSRSGVASKKVG